MRTGFKGFLANGGLLLLVGVLLAVVSIVVSMAAIFAPFDPFTVLTRQNVTFQLGGNGAVIGAAYFIVVALLIGIGAYRLAEHAENCSKEEIRKPDLPTDSSRLHPA